jgi:murein DD-endopeptidase MepM/ murein hydrolase activator NlpD
MRLILLLFLTISLFAKEKIYTYSQVKNDVVEVYIVNKELFDITYRYQAEYKNLVPMQELPIEESLKSGSKKIIAKYIISGHPYKLSNKYSWVVGNKSSFHTNHYLYKLPFQNGTSHYITQGFNGVFSHRGDSKYAVDFGMKVGTKIYASRAGMVVMIKEDSNKNGKNKHYAKDANFVTLKHSDGTYGKYVHLKKNGVIVQVGDFVKRGQFLGYSGNTGFTNGPHLHFVVFKGKGYKSRKSIPIKFIAKNGIVTNPIRGKKYTAVK